MTNEEKENLKVGVIVAFETGLNLNEIAEKFHMRQSTALSIISDYDKLKIKALPVRVQVGHKDEAYYTEKEMLKGLPTYTLDSLSPSEKIILNSKKLKEWYKEEMCSITLGQKTPTE